VHMEAETTVSPVRRSASGIAASEGICCTQAYSTTAVPLVPLNASVLIRDQLDRYVQYEGVVITAPRPCRG
jgi:hypothetical protein